MGLRQPGQPQQQKQQQLPEYEAMRRRTQQRLQSEAQTQRDALQRRFAQVGNLNSGAAMKNEQVLQDQLARQQDDAIGQIDLQETAETQRRAEVQQGMDFQAAEAQKGRDFQGGIFNQEFGLKNRAFDAEQKARSFQEGMATREFDRDSSTLDFTKAQAILESGNGAAIEKILGDIDGGRFGGGYDQVNQGGALARRAKAKTVAAAQVPKVDIAGMHKYLQEKAGKSWVLSARKNLEAAGYTPEQIAMFGASPEYKNAYKTVANMGARRL